MIGGRLRLALADARLFLLAGFCQLWFSTTIADPDLWGHVRFGQAIIKSGSPIQTDIYSYRTLDQRWINHEWLSEVIFAALYDRWGPPGLVGLKLVVSVLLMVLSYVRLRRRGTGPWASFFLLVLLSIPFRMGLGAIRPQIFTYLLLFVELLIIEKGTTAGPAWFWLLPGLFAVWVNLHGGVLAGVGVLCIWIVARLMALSWSDANRAQRRTASMFRLALMGVASGGALLLNPYGAELVVFLLRTGTVARPEISEWAPLALLSLQGRIYLALLAIGVTGLVASRRPRTGNDLGLHRDGRLAARF